MSDAGTVSSGTEIIPSPPAGRPRARRDGDVSIYASSPWCPAPVRTERGIRPSGGGRWRAPDHSRFPTPLDQMKQQIAASRVRQDVACDFENGGRDDRNVGGRELELGGESTPVLTRHRDIGRILDRNPHSVTSRKDLGRFDEML